MPLKLESNISGATANSIVFRESEVLILPADKENLVPYQRRVTLNDKLQKQRSSITLFAVFSGNFRAALIHCLIIFSLSLALPVFSQEKITSAAEIDYPPFSVTDSEGLPDGFSVELLNAAADAMGREVSYRTGTWEEVRTFLEKGEIMALPLVGRTPEREYLFDFTFPYMSLYGAIVVRKGTEDIQATADLEGKKVAVMKGDNAEEYLLRSGLKIDLYSRPTFIDALRDLSKGLYNAVVIQRIVALRIIQEEGLANLEVINRPIADFKQDFCFAVKKGDSRTLAVLNEGLSIVIADGTFQKLYSRWFASLELPLDRRLVIGGDSDYPPFEFINDKGIPAGFNVDLTRAIAREMGLDIEIRLDRWTDVINDFEKERIDVLQGMFYSEERDLRFDFSQPHTIINNVAVVRKGEGPAPSSLEDLKGKTILVQKGDIMHDFLAENNLGRQAVTTESPGEALKKLHEGFYDCALVSRIIAEMIISKNGWDNLETGVKPFLTTEYCYAVLNDRKALLTQFSEGLKIIAESGEYRKIYEKWMGVYEEQHTDIMEIIRYTSYAFIPFFLILIASFAWSRSLKKIVAIKTAELEKSEAVFRSLIEGAPDAIFIHSDYRFRYMNTRACRLFGIDRQDRLLEKDIRERFHPSSRVMAEERVFNLYNKRSFAPAAEQLYLRLDGSAVPVEITAVPIEYNSKPAALVFVRDITERKDSQKARELSEEKSEALEKQLLQAQKMESVGRLAGGIAHDFNNMLSVISGYTELAMDKVMDNDSIYSDLREILNATNRSAEITKQLLAFARKQAINPRVLDLNATVEKMLKTLTRLIGEDIDLAWIPGQEIGKIKMDPTQIDQILANLCVNSRDAITGVGKITIETRNTIFDSAYCYEHDGFLPGEYVQLAVSDNGQGMDENTVNKIFEPFFTTKKQGKGTGLGLATVYGIVKQNNGFINVYSEPGKGTTIRIYIPVCESGIAEDNRLAADQVPGGRGETVFLVEDESAILEIGKRMLEKLGYRVWAFGTPNEALAAAEKIEGSIDILVTDVVMPEMNGKSLSTKITSFFPKIKTIYISGYTADVIAHHGILEDGIQLLQKPFSINELALKIRAVLDA